MARRKDFIPQRDAEFNNWQDNFTDGVQPNLAAWQIPAAEWSALISHKLEWSAAYDKAKNKRTRTSADVERKKVARKAYVAKLREFINARIRANPLISTADKKKLGLTVKDIEPTPRAKIVDVPYVMVRAMPGSYIEIRCQVTKDATRPSRHPDADGIELRYKIGDPPPTGPDFCPNTIIFTRAVHRVRLNPQDAGKKLYAFIRWKNTTDDTKSGPWTELHTTVITV